jgi:aspartate/methionine/tyrosine aminotransferase
MWDTGEPDQPITRLVEILVQKYHPDARLYLSGSPYARLPDHVREAVAASVSRQGYAPSRGEPGLREAIAVGLADRGVRAAPEQVLVTDGAMHALDLVFRSILEPGDEVLMPAPGFFIQGLVRRAGGRLVRFPSPAGDQFRPSWEAAQTFLTKRTKILYVNTPVNPTGYVYDEADIAAAVELADRAGLILLSDESLAHFVYGGHPHLSPAGAASGWPSGVLVGSFSKDYAMPGLRIGYAVMPAHLLSRVSALLEWSVLAVSRPAQAAALAALTGPREWVERMVADAAARGPALAAELAAIPGLSCLPPRGGLNLFPGFAGDAERLTHDLVVQFGVPVCPGSAFGGTGHFRLQFGGAEHDLRRAVRHIRDAVASTAAGEET